jgi:sodium transport system ATP-binding protein
MIRAQDLTRTFSGKNGTVTAVNRVSFHIAPGEVVGLIGENGAGKTTTLRMIATLLEPTSGELAVLGEDVRINTRKVRSRIGVLFGGETGLYDRLTARENLEYFARLYGIGRHESQERIKQLASQFGMKEYLDRKVGGFSKGMRQKLAIARTLIHDPDLILFDEPTTGLDITSANIFRQLVRQLNREGKTIIFSSHIMEEVQMLCNSAILIHKGELVYHGSLEELYDQEDSRDLNYIFMSRLARGA